MKAERTPTADSVGRPLVHRPRSTSVLLTSLLLSATLFVPGCEPPEGTRGWQCIAPAAAGGGWDLTCRVTGRILQESGVTPGAVRTINMPGAGGGVAFAHTVGQRRNDPRVLVAASPATTLRLAQGQYGHLEVGDVRWVAALGAEYGIVAVADDSPWLTLRDLLTAWAADPEAIVVSGGSAVAGQDHMKILLLGREAGIDPLRVRYVPFDGGGEAMTALLGGFVQVFSGEASEVESHMESGSIRVLGVLSAERVTGLLRDVPTASEQGYPVEWITWRGFYVPGEVTEEEYDRWVRVLTEVAESSEWTRARDQARLRPFFMAGDSFQAFVEDQVAEFRGLAQEIGLIR